VSRVRAHSANGLAGRRAYALEIFATGCRDLNVAHACGLALLVKVDEVIQNFGRPQD
jgi:hypothetical protein